MDLFEQMKIINLITMITDTNWVKSELHRDKQNSVLLDV